MDSWRNSPGHYDQIMGKGRRMSNGKKMWEETKSVGCAWGSNGDGGFAHCWFAES